jgi:Ca2+/H+ antiporter
LPGAGSGQRIGTIMIGGDMNHTHHKHARSSGRTIIAVLSFLLLFTILLVLVNHYYVIPGIEAQKHMDHAGRRKLAANAMLVMILMLTLLVVGLLITFRISRFFFPRPMSPRTRTKVIDAWMEAGKRMEKESVEGESDSDSDD